MKPNGTPAKVKTDKQLKGTKVAKATPVKFGKAKKDALAEAATAILAEAPATPAKGAIKVSKATPAKGKKGMAAKVAAAIVAEEPATPGKGAGKLAKATPVKATPAKAKPAKATPAKAAKATPAKTPQVKRAAKKLIAKANGKMDNKAKGKAVPTKKLVQAKDSDDDEEDDDDDGSDAEMENDVELNAALAESDDEDDDEDVEESEDDDDDDDAEDADEPANGLIANEAEEDDNESEDGESEEDDDDDEDVAQPANNIKKVMTKPKAAAKEDSDDDEDEDDDEDDNNDEEMITKPKAAAESDSDDDDDDDDDEDAASNVKNVKAKPKTAAKDKNAEDDDDDSAPTEAKIQKQATKSESQFKNAKINFKFIDRNTPHTKIIHITGLPPKKSFKPMDIAEIFYKYGTIKSIVIYPGDLTCSAHIAYENEDAAKAALAENKKAIIKNHIVEVAPKPKMTAAQLSKMPQNFYNNREVLVENISADTTAQDLEEHFKECGTILKAEINNDDSVLKGSLVFETALNLEEALKLNNTELKGVQISVKKRYQRSERPVLKSEQLTVTLMNKDSAVVDEAKVREIFEKCGKIQGIEVLNRKNVLAFVTFADEDAVKKALELNGSTVNDLQLELNLFQKIVKEKTTILVHNLHPNVTENEIREHFKTAGEIVGIKRSPAFTTVQFANSEAYCKSFLLDEAYLGGSITFIVPYSTKKKYFDKIKHSGMKPKPGNKRPANNQQNDKMPYFYSKGGVPPHKRFKKTTNKVSP